MQEPMWGVLSIIQNKFDSEFVKPYKPYLIFGDAYVDFINYRDNWSEKIRAPYAKFPQEITQYLGFMDEHFTCQLQTEAETDIKEWLRSYSKRSEIWPRKLSH